MYRNTLLKKITILLFVVLMVPMAWASEISTIWANLYEEADTLDQKFVIMERLIQENDRDLIPTLMEAQGDLLLTSKDRMSNKEHWYHKNIQQMILVELGELKAAEAGEILFKSLNEISDPFIKADIITSMGQVGAIEYAEPLAMMLRNFNLGVLYMSTREATETMVSSLVTALERLKEPVGFEPVFYTAVGRNTKKIQAAAERSLYNMMEDPTPTLGEILISTDDFATKLKALEFANGSTASAEGKTNVAAIALDEGLKHPAENLRQMTTLGRLRTSAANILAENGFNNSGVSANLGEMLEMARRETQDMNELFSCFKALAAGEGDVPVQILADHLAKLNNLQKEGIVITDQREITQLIQSLGATGNSLARAQLVRIEFSNWNSAVNREAKAALAKLQ